MAGFKALVAVMGFAAVLAHSLPAVSQNFGKQRPCGNLVQQELSKIGVKPGDIESSLTEKDIETSDGGDVFLGWVVWMKLKSCDGKLVINFPPTCVAGTIYTTGQCNISGVKNY